MVIKLLSGHDSVTDRHTLRSKEGNIHASVMVLLHAMLSECALQMYEVSLKYL